MARTARRSGWPVLEFDGARLPIAGRSVGALLSITVLQYLSLSQLKLVAAELGRIAVPNARLLAIEQVTSAQIGRGHARHEYTGALEEAGFAVQRICRLRAGHSKAITAAVRLRLPAGAAIAILRREAWFIRSSRNDSYLEVAIEAVRS
jgi:hypothetical protein